MQITNFYDETDKKKIMGSNMGKSVKARENISDGNGKNNGASLEISNEAMRRYMEQFRQDMERTKEQNKESSDDFGKIMTIYRRIAKGDKVPGKDEKKLLKYSNELYQAAKMSASIANNKKPKKYKSVEDNDRQSENRMVENITDTDRKVNETEDCNACVSVDKASCEE